MTRSEQRVADVSLRTAHGDTFLRSLLRTATLRKHVPPCRTSSSSGPVPISFFIVLSVQCITTVPSMPLTRSRTWLRSPVLCVVAAQQDPLSITRTFWLLQCAGGHQLGQSGSGRDCRQDAPITTLGLKYENVTCQQLRCITLPNVVRRPAGQLGFPIRGDAQSHIPLYQSLAIDRRGSLAFRWIAVLRRSGASPRIFRVRYSTT